MAHDRKRQKGGTVFNELLMFYKSGEWVIGFAGRRILDKKKGALSII
jgi:hypothetical protein